MYKYFGVLISTFFFTVTARADLLLDYRFNDAVGANVPNNGTLGAGSDGTVSGAASISSGARPFVGGAVFSVTANGGVMTSAETASTDSLNAFTLAFWAKPNEPIANWQDMIADVDPAPANAVDGWNLMTMGNGSLRLRVWQEAPGNLLANFDSSAGAMVQDEWHHYTVVANALTVLGTRSITVDYYRDGTLLNQASVSSSLQMGDSDAGFAIGNTMWDGELLADYGRVELHNVALDANQVMALYNGTLIPEPGTLGLVLFGVLALRGLRRS